MQVDGSRINEATEALGITLPTQIVEYNTARIIDPVNGKRIAKYLNILNPKKLYEYRSEGCILSNELVDDLNTSSARISIYLHELYTENWADGLLTVANNHRRVYVIPPEMRANLRRYHTLSHERQMLGVWRSMVTRGTMDYKDYLETDLKTMKKEKFEKLSRNGQTAIKIFDARDIIKLNDEDCKMLVNLASVYLVTKYKYLLDVVFKSPQAIRSREEAFCYMRSIVGGLRFSYNSEGDFTTILRKKMFEFVTKRKLYEH